MTIIKINGAQIVLRDHHGKEHRRNSSHVKKYWTKKETQHLEEDDGSVIDVPSQHGATTSLSYHPTTTTPNA